MDIFSKTSQFPKKHHRCISLESGQTLTKKSYPKTPLDLPRFYPRRYSTPELAMRKHALKYQRDDSRNEQPISNKSCQTDILGLDKYLHRSPPGDTSVDSAGHSAVLRTYKKPVKKPKVRSVGVHCERRRMTFAAFKGCQKFKHVYKRKISLPQPSSTATSTDDGRRDSGVLPKLRPDRPEAERPAAARAVPAVKLPKIPTRDARPDPDRTDECAAGGGTRLARLTRPQSTGSSGGGCSSSSGADRTLAYFRASSAPKIDTRYYTLVSAPQPPPPPPEREQLSTAGSSDCTADTTLDMSFVRRQSGENAPAAAAASTTAGTSSTTRTVSTSTTFAEPVFPIVFSCESVLRHPLDGGYVSHTESHRFSVHYVPADDAKAVTTTDDTDDGSRSSLVFTSAGACQNERCLTGDSICVTVCGGGGGAGGKPTDDSAAVSRYEPSAAAGERRLFVERSNADVFETAAGQRPPPPPAADRCRGSSTVENCCPVVERPSAEKTVAATRDGRVPACNGGRENGGAAKTTESHVSETRDDGDVNGAFERAAAAVPPMPANKTIDDFRGDDDGGAEDDAPLESHHAHDDMPFRSAERNYERLTQNDQTVVEPGRTVPNQSPGPEGTGTRRGTTVDRHDDDSPGPVEDDAARATESNAPRVVVQPAEPPTVGQSVERPNIVQPTERTTVVQPAERPNVVQPTERTTVVQSAEQPTVVQPAEQPNVVQPTERPTVVQPAEQPTVIQLAEQPTVAADAVAAVTDRFDGESTRPVVVLQSDDDDADDSSYRPYDSEAAMSPPHGRRLQRFDSIVKRDVGTDRRSSAENADRPSIARPAHHHGESTDRRYSEYTSAGHRRNIPVRLNDHMSRKRDDDGDPRDHRGELSAGRHLHPMQHVDRNPQQQHVDRNPRPQHAAAHLDMTATVPSCSNVANRSDGHEPADAQSRRQGATNDLQHRRPGPIGNRSDEAGGKRLQLQRSKSTLHDRAGGEDGNACSRCADNGDASSHGKNEMKTGAEGRRHDATNANKSVESGDYNHHRHHSESAQHGVGSDNKNPAHSTYRRQLESVDETTESKASNYVGGYLFGDVRYKKQPHKYDAERCYDDPKRVNFTSRPNFEYYHDYVPGTVHSPRDEDCTVFAEVPRDPDDCKNKGRHAPNDHHRFSTGTATGTPAQVSYYSQLDRSYGDDKNTDSDESLTDSLEDGCKYDGAAVSYFLSLNGQKSAVTFTLKMPNTLESRLNRRHSQLKKHLHVSTTVRKTSTRVRMRHKSCQTLWTEEKGVQVQRGSTANANRRPVDDFKVLETLLAGMSRHHVSENQIRVVGGQKLVSEGIQTERMPEPPTDRQTQTTRDAAAGTETPDILTAGGPNNRGQSHSMKKFSSDNALMVGVVRRNKYKGKEATDGTKNDQLVTLSKGWINFYTLRGDSADCTDAQELHNNDDEVKTEDDSQQYTVHVEAIPEPVTLPVVHVPNRNSLQMTKTCSTVKHLPKLIQTENSNHSAPHLAATANGWCVSVDGPNNMHMKVSLLPDKLDNKTSEHFDHNEENKLESRRLALQKKNSYMRKPYRNMKRTQSTPRDMFSADVSRTESALSAESKYIETIDTQLLIHKARRRLSQEWDTRTQNGGVTESVQLVVTGDSVSSRASQHYANRGHQHCSFRRQSRRI